VAAQLEQVEERLRALLDRHRPELVTGSIYGVPAWVWPGATGHDYFAALKRGKAAVGMYLIVMDRHPDVLELAPERLRACRTGRATLSFRALDDEIEAALAALLDGLLERYRAEHAAP
jgi:hypothetical protein